MKADEKHFRNVAALPCAQCGIHNYSQCAHSNRSTDGKGGGLKADFRATFPLCCTRPGEIGCHVRHDQYIGITREEASARTDRYLSETETTLRALGQWPEAADDTPRVSKHMRKTLAELADKPVRVKKASSHKWPSRPMQSRPFGSR